MLVLSRKKGEKIILPDCGVTITVTSVSSNKVSLGFTAPAHERIHRQEVWLRDHADEGIAASADRECVPMSRR